MEPFASCCSLGKMGQSFADRRRQIKARVLSKCSLKRRAMRYDPSGPLSTGPPPFFHSNHVRRDQLSGCSLCSLHQRAPPLPASPPHWSRLNVSASAVISIRQGCKHLMANPNFQHTDMHTPMCVVRLLTLPIDTDNNGGTRRAYRGCVCGFSVSTGNTEEITLQLGAFFTASQVLARWPHLRGSPIAFQSPTFRSRFRI